jgi:hypothetical protein
MRQHTTQLGKERRQIERRQDAESAHRLLRAWSLQRVLGKATASNILRRAGVVDDTLLALLSFQKDRRRCKRRRRSDMIENERTTIAICIDGAHR